MTTLYLIVPLALVIAAISVLAFAWSVRSGQLDDLDTPAHRLLFDDQGDAATTDQDQALARGDEGHGSRAAGSSVGSRAGMSS